MLIKGALSSYKQLFALTGEPYEYFKRNFVGETVHLKCGNAEALAKPVYWYYQPSPDAEGHQIIVSGSVPNGGFGGRVDISGSTLIINNIQKDDSGVFTCAEDTGSGPIHRIVLTVQGKFSE